jgi:hypothetical protein
MPGEGRGAVRRERTRMAKFNINFSDSTHAVLVELSERLDVPMADVIREALSLYWWFAREQASGNQLLIQRGDKLTELMIPSLEALSSDQRLPGKTQRPTKRGSTGKPDSESIRASA